MGLTITRVERDSRTTGRPTPHKYHSKRTFKTRTSRRKNRKGGSSSRGLRSAECSRERAKSNEEESLLRTAQESKLITADPTISLETSKQSCSHEVEESTRAIQEGQLPETKKQETLHIGAGEQAKKEEIIEPSKRIIGLTHTPVSGNSDADLLPARRTLAIRAQDKGTINLKTKENRKIQLDKVRYYSLESMLEGLCQLSVNLLNSHNTRIGISGLLTPDNSLDVGLSIQSFTVSQDQPSLIQPEDERNYQIMDKLLSEQVQLSVAPACDISRNVIPESICPTAPEQQILCEPVFKVPILPIKCHLNDKETTERYREKFLNRMCECTAEPPPPAPPQYYPVEVNDWAPVLDKKDTMESRSYSVKIDEKDLSVSAVVQREDQGQVTCESFSAPTVSEMVPKEEPCVYGQWAYLHPVLLVNGSEAWRPYADVCPCVNCSYSLGSCLALLHPKIGWEQLYCAMNTTSFLPFPSQ